MQRTCTIQPFTSGRQGLRNAVVRDTEQLLKILDSLGSAFPRLRRVGIYASARDILGKTDADLAMLQQRKLEIVYPPPPK